VLPPLPAQLLHTPESNGAPYLHAEVKPTSYAGAFLVPLCSPSSICCGACDDGRNLLTSTTMPATSNGFHYDDVSALRDPDPNIPDVATYEPNSNPDHHHATTGAFRRRKMGCTWRHEDGNNHHYHDRGASYRVYQHAEMKDRILHTAGYALPATPRNHTSRAAAALAKSAPREVINALSSRITLSTPSYLRQLYNMMEYVPAATLQNTLAVAGYFGDYPRQEDLTTFMEKYRSDGLTATFSLMQVDGEALPNGPSEEASSNIQYTATLTYPTPQTFYSASYGGESFLVWVNYVLTQRDIPQTISTSYDGNEQDLNEAYATVSRDYLHGYTALVEARDA
ncbi:hypothetical protein EDB89DRAFT_2181759, partial [Lactarius sanguifluus]